MDVSSLLGNESNALAAKRVFGEPIERDGTVLIPAAVVRGGGGGGEGRSPEGAKQPEGAGIGFGLAAHPAGAFVLRHGRVRWRPAIDVNRIVLGGQIVALTALIVAALIRRAPRASIRARRLGPWRALRLARAAI